MLTPQKALQTKCARVAAQHSALSHRITSTTPVCNSDEGCDEGVMDDLIRLALYCAPARTQMPKFRHPPSPRCSQDHHFCKPNPRHCYREAMNTMEPPNRSECAVRFISSTAQSSLTASDMHLLRPQPSMAMKKTSPANLLMPTAMRNSQQNRSAHFYISELLSMYSNTNVDAGKACRGSLVRYADCLGDGPSG
jgi:hypothetical protein